MHKEKYLKKLNDALANDENDIEKIIVFYKSGEKLQIGCEELDNKVLKVELAEEKSSTDDNDINTYNDDKDWKYNKSEVVEKAMDNSTISQVIYFPTGRKINVIY